jgi:phosphatidate cytidylyltransferase
MLRTRVITALLLLGALLLVLFVLPRPAALAALALVAVLAAREWAPLAELSSTSGMLLVLVVAASCAGVALMPELMPGLWLASAAFWLLAVPLWLQRAATIRGRPTAGFAVGWLLLVPTWAALAALYDRGPWWLLAALAMIWVADIAAYFAGRAFGRHKLAPSISPGKTWEGVAGAVVGVLVYAEVASRIALDRDIGLAGALLLVVLVAVSVIGDLFESLAKRQAGVKDSGNTLPGHGGILDRIDSQTSALPLLALTLAWWT